jgi:hypothetical protein
MGVKRPGREADHSPPSNAEVKEGVDLYLKSPNTPSLRGAQLKKESTGTTLPFTFIPKCSQMPGQKLSSIRGLRLS